MKPASRHHHTSSGQQVVVSGLRLAPPLSASVPVRCCAAVRPRTNADPRSQYSRGGGGEEVGLVQFPVRLFPNLDVVKKRNEPGREPAFPERQVCLPSSTGCLFWKWSPVLDIDIYLCHQERVSLYYLPPFDLTSLETDSLLALPMDSWQSLTRVVRQAGKKHDGCPCPGVWPALSQRHETTCTVYEWSEITNMSHRRGLTDWWRSISKLPEDELSGSAWLGEVLNCPFK